MSDAIPETLFEQLYRRDLTAADRRRLLDVKSALRLSDHDELWPLIMTLDHYSVIICAAEKKIIKVFAEQRADVEAAVKASELAATRNANRAVAGAVVHGVELLCSMVAKRSETTADRTSKRQLITAATIGGLVALLIFGLGAAGAYYFIDSIFGICTGDTFMLSDGRSGCFD